jgi:copper(I)-binding protein
MLAAAGIAAPLAHGEDNGLAVSDGWMRMIIPSRPAAGYFTLRNNGAKDRVLTGASSPACGTVMLHRSVTADGAEKMEMVDKVTVPAHGTLQFAPHGYHLMCMKPSPAMEPGKDVPVTLRFLDGSALTTAFKVKGASGG